MLIAKLSPNVTDISEIACAAEEAGADAISLVNTFTALAVDIDTLRPKLANGSGGLSGPAIKPIAVKMVHDVYKAVKIPIIGMGGIMNSEDALEFMIAGATAISIGTANFVNPGVSMEVLKGIKDYCRKKNFKSVRKIIGKLKR
jgi:dihydroorotate dehydrogenase (NAD+) catalytic subunit